MRRVEETTYNYLKYTTSVGGGLSPLDKAVITNVAKTLKVSPAKLKNYNASFSSTSTRGNDLSHYASMVWNGKKIEIHATESVFNPTIRIVSILGPKNAFCAPSTVKEARRFLGL